MERLPLTIKSGIDALTNEKIFTVIHCNYTVFLLPFIRNLFNEPRGFT